MATPNKELDPYTVGVCVENVSVVTMYFMALSLFIAFVSSAIIVNPFISIVILFAATMFRLMGKELQKP